MKWQLYLVTYFFSCVIIDCKVNNVWESSVINKPKGGVLKSMKSDNVTVDIVNDLLENKTVDGNDFMKGKRCLKNLDKCIKEDTTYHTSGSHLTNYMLSRMPPFDLSSADGVSEECQASSKIFIEDLHTFRYWALQMYDATAKVPSGFLSGNVLHFGDFDLCMMSRNDINDIYGKYCLANIQFELPSSAYLAAIYNLVHAHGLFKSKLGDSGHIFPRYSSVQWGLCVPDSCSPMDVEMGLKEALKEIFNGTEIQYNTFLNSELCSSARPQPWPTSTIVGCIFFLSVILLETLATVYDMFWTSNKKDIILAFSMKKNLQNLVTLPKADDLDAVHVVRFVNGLLLLVAHKIIVLLHLPYINRTALAESGGQTWAVLGRAATLYTDAFIMLSGTLTAYSVFGRLNKSQKINIFEDYVSRILRILPTFAALILFCTLVLPWTNSGPLWNSVVTQCSDICKKNWWRNIFFIHSYFGFREICLPHTYHIGVDTQLFFLSPLLILTLWKWPKRGIFTLVTIATISTAMRYYNSYTKKLANYIHYGVSIEKIFLTADNLYTLPTHRLTAYIMGIILAYLLRQYKNATFKPVYIHIGNVIVFLCFYGAFIAPSFMGHLDYTYDPKYDARYAAYAPILWCLCFAWFIYVTHIGYTGYVSVILRNPIPKYWTKISYTVYLIQFPIYFYNVGITKHTDEFGVFRKQLNVLELFWVVLLAIILTLLFELPSHNIRHLIFKKRTSKQITSDAENSKYKVS